MATTPGDTPSEWSIDELLASPSGEAFHEYLVLMEDTEPPRNYLIWSLISAAATLLGKNSKFRSGPLHSVAPNLFIVLLGPAGVRKSSAIRLVQHLMEHTTVNFGPTDSGGQRQGLMSALTGLHRQHAHARWLPDRVVDSGPMTFMMSQPRRASDMALYVAELGTLFGSGVRDLADFMVNLYDGTKIDYETKAGATEIHSPLVNLLGATVPSSLAAMIPDNAGTHGILSRMLFIYEDKPHKAVPLPKEPTELWWDQRKRIIDRFHWIDNNRLDFMLEPRAAKFYEAIYGYVPLIQDARLEHYRERRANILLRVSMAICALRLDTCIIESDLRLAHEFMKLAEPRMHKALEYFGRNKIFAGRMLMIQFLRANGGQSTHEALVAAAASELKHSEADEAINNMLASGELVKFGSGYVLGEIRNELTERKAGVKRGPRAV